MHKYRFTADLSAVQTGSAGALAGVIIGSFCLHARDLSAHH